MALNGLVANKVADHYFVSNTDPGATEGGHGHFLYKTDTGPLSWDADGTGAGDAVVIATLFVELTLLATDFLLT